MTPSFAWIASATGTALDPQKLWRQSHQPTERPGPVAAYWRLSCLVRRWYPRGPWSASQAALAIVVSGFRERRVEGGGGSLAAHR